MITVMGCALRAAIAHAGYRVHGTGCALRAAIARWTDSRSIRPLPVYEYVTWELGVGVRVRVRVRVTSHRSDHSP